MIFPAIIAMVASHQDMPIAINELPEVPFSGDQLREE